MDWTDPKQCTVKDVAAELERTWEEVRPKWFYEQMRVLRKIKKMGVGIMVVDPTKIFEELYGFKVGPDQSTKTFLERLQEALK